MLRLKLNLMNGGLEILHLYPSELSKELHVHIVIKAIRLNKAASLSQKQRMLK